MDNQGKKVLLVANVVKEHVLKFHVPTIRYLIEHDAKVILMSHMGRPKGEPKPEFTLLPVADRLRELLGQDAA